VTQAQQVATPSRPTTSSRRHENLLLDAQNATFIPKVFIFLSQALSRRVDATLKANSQSRTGTPEKTRLTRLPVDRRRDAGQADCRSAAAKFLKN